jgi:conjugative coupling factor TraD (TOL family)
MPYPIDNLFRKPVELLAATTSLAGAIALALGSPSVGIPSIATTVASAGLFTHSAWRFRQAWRVIRFQLNLRWLPTYELSSDQIPVSKTEMFLGQGFWWTQKHTQRLYMARLPKYEHLRARNASYMWAREFARNYPQNWLAQLLNWRHRLNPVAPLPPVGGDPAIHGIEPDEMPIWTALSERVGHTIVLGTTRVGKTRLAELLITQDIRRGDVVIVFDPKGDVKLLQRMYAEACRSGRQDQFYFFHLGYPEVSDRYSPVSTIGRITEVATRIANALPSEGQSAAFRDFVWRFVNVMAKAMNLLGESPTYESIYSTAINIDGLCQRYFEFWLDRDHPGWREEFEATDYGGRKDIAKLVEKTGRAQQAIFLRQFILDKGYSDLVADGLSGVLSNDKTYFEKLVSSLYPLLEKLTTGKISELLSPKWDDPTDRRRSFDWDKIINTGGIVYAGLDALSDYEVAGVVGNAAFADLVSTAGRRYKFGGAYGQAATTDIDRGPRVSIHADEFNELIGDEFVPLLNKAGGAGYQVTAYTQTWSDVEARLGSASKAAQVGGNLNTMIMLRVKNTETAELLTDQLPMVEVYSTTMVSGANDAKVGDFESFSAGTQDRLTQREVPMIRPADLVQLPKGQAFALLEGGQLAKIRLPLATSDADDVHWPAGMNAVFAGMHAQYQRYLHQIGDPDDHLREPLTVEGFGRGF